MRKNALSVITIGQSPRTDLEADFRWLRKDGIDIVETGALDGLSAEEISSYAPDIDEYTLVTRIRDGSQVKIGREKIVPVLQRKIDESVATGIEVAILLCSCEFPELYAKRGFLIEPSRILFDSVCSFARGKRLAVIMPTPEQILPAQKKWGTIGGDVFVSSASPYIDPEMSLITAAKKIEARDADICILDCAGFSLWMKELIHKETGLPTISALSITVKVAAELVQNAFSCWR